jgi:hypothetical protein
MWKKGLMSPFYPYKKEECNQSPDPQSSSIPSIKVLREHKITSIEVFIKHSIDGLKITLIKVSISLFLHSPLPKSTTKIHGFTHF